MKVAVTGATGFVGKAVVEDLSRDMEVIALGRKGGSILQMQPLERVSYAECGYTVPELRELCEGADAIINLASQKVVKGEPNGLEDYRSSLELLEHVLRAAAENGIKNVITISSRCVYGEQNTLPYSEDETPDPINFYAVEKVMGETLSEYYNRKKGLCVKNLRLAQVIGYPMNDGYMFSTFLRQIQEGETVRIWGNGVGKRDYIYLKDVTQAIRCALSAKEEKGIFNIGSGIGVSNVEIAEWMKEVFHSNSEIQMLREKPEDKSIVYLDMNKTKERLHFSCRFSMQDVIRDIAEQIQRES